ncbi:uncharacterized protein Fot_27916 [Forsythia ovata]|uniref:F-box domain-containing protein n=1 Tax=Forsythia ovata TaxID=205694 RepID=A0ABD1TMI1_9LAMI
MAEILFISYTNLGQYLTLISKPSLLFNYLLEGIWVNNKTKEDHTDTTSLWNRIPSDIMEVIARKLGAGDRARISSVCKSWRSILVNECIRKLPEIPWLLMPPQDPGNVTLISFYSLFEGRIYNFKMPKIQEDEEDDYYGKWVCGSVRGWLVIVGGSYLNPYMILFNPISGAIIDLPPLTTIPSINDFTFNVSHFVRQVELINPDVESESIIVAAVFGTQENMKLAFCRPDDESWTIFQGYDYYIDILFQNGTLHSVVYKLPDDEEVAKIRKNLFKLSDDCEIKLKFYLFMDSLDLFNVETETHSGFTVLKNVANSSYFVESTSGQLLLVHTTFDSLQKDREIEDENDHMDDEIHEEENDHIDDEIHEENNHMDDETDEEDEDEDENDHMDHEIDEENNHMDDEIDEEDDEIDEEDDDDEEEEEEDDDEGGLHLYNLTNDLVYFRTSKFAIFDITHGYALDDELGLTDLGDQALFVASSGSLSLPINENCKEICRKNCIYFALSTEKFLHIQCPKVSREIGVFNLEQGKITRCFPSETLPSMSKIGWFTPSQS